MKKAQQKQPSSLEAKKLFDEKHYRKALEAYKVLLKQEPSDHYRKAVCDCYIKRAEELGKKKMYQEAVTLWENHSPYCSASCDHAYLYVCLLIATKSEAKAGTVFIKMKASFSPEQYSTLEELFAALLFGKSQPLLGVFPSDSLLIKDLAVLNTALAAYAQGDLEQAGSGLNSISFRSPYKELRQALKAFFMANSNKALALATLERIPSASPFYRLASLIQLNLNSQLDLARLLPTLNQTEFLFLSALKGWSGDQQKYLTKLCQLPEPSKPKLLFELIINNPTFTDRLIARRLCYSLLPLVGQPAIKTFQQVFGLLTAEESLHLNTLIDAHNREYTLIPPWIQYEALLATHEQTPTIKLKRALALRQAADIIKLYDPKNADTALPAKRGLPYLEKSLGLDPDKATYGLVIAYFRQHGPKKFYRSWVDQALQFLPNDKDVILWALEAYHGQKKSSLGLELANQLLALDPIHRTALQYWVEFQLMKVRPLILKKKWKPAEAILKAVTLKASDASLKNKVQIYQGLYEYAQGHTGKASNFIKPCIENNILNRLKLYQEAKQLKIKSTALDWDLNLKAPTHFQNSSELIQVIHYIEQEMGGLSLELFEVIITPLDAALKLPFTIKELITLGGWLTQFRQFNLLLSFGEHQPAFSKIPILIYYLINAKIEGDPEKLESKDRDLLEQALETAYRTRDIRAGNLIGELLTTDDDDDDDDDDDEYNEDGCGVCPHCLEEKRKAKAREHA